jgi:hypothetical protein
MFKSVQVLEKVMPQMTVVWTRKGNRNIKIASVVLKLMWDMVFLCKGDHLIHISMD